MKVKSLFYTVCAADGWWWSRKARAWVNIHAVFTASELRNSYPRTLSPRPWARTRRQAFRIAMRCPAVTTIERRQLSKTDLSSGRVLRTWTNTPVAVKKEGEAECTSLFKNEE